MEEQRGSWLFDNTCMSSNVQYRFSRMSENRLGGTNIAWEVREREEKQSDEEFTQLELYVLVKLI